MEAIFPSISAVLTLTLIGAVFGLILSVAKIKLKVDKDHRIDLVLDALPGANCGACGLPGCSGYAAKIVTENMDITLCPVGGSETIHEIAEILGREAGEAGVPVKARIHCQGGLANTIDNFIYVGPRDCNAANNIMGGFLGCSYGCLGYGDCVKVCPFDAIEMNDNRLPVVNLSKCTGCGNCADICPRGVISMIPETFDVWVNCKNTEKTPIMKKGCSVGCIGCKICEKACKEVFADNPDVESAIKVENFLATIDYDVCTNCYSCVKKCPVPVISPVHMAVKKKPKEKKKEDASIKAATESKEGAQSESGTQNA
jgi:Na+-translocating ferredoxin:NAD+ oxidoreductase subunit B